MRKQRWLPLLTLTLCCLGLAGALTARGGDTPSAKPGIDSGLLLAERTDFTPEGRVFDASRASCGSQDDNPPGVRPTYAWEDNFTALTRLGNHWMPNFGDGDSMTSPLWLDHGTAAPFGSEGLRETWYIARDHIANTAPLYRLLGNGNHVDSPYTSEGVHSLDLGIPHGYAWTTAEAGRLPIRRYLKTSISDHRTWLFDQTPSGYAGNATYWATGATPRLGYQRFGNKLDLCDVLAKGYGTYLLENTKLEIDFNKIWGGAIGRITYKPRGSSWSARRSVTWCSRRSSVGPRPIRRGHAVSTTPRSRGGRIPGTMATPTSGRGARSSARAIKAPTPRAGCERFGRSTSSSTPMTETIRGVL
jgi:hypothetical protein